MATLTVDKSQLTLVRETKELLEQLLETLDVMADKRLLRDIENLSLPSIKRAHAKFSSADGGIRP